jgi:anti-sigma B factor antagonist
MQLDIQDASPTITKVLMTGRFDIAGAREIDLPFNVLVGSRRKLIIDLSGVEFIASMGLRTLIMGAHTVASKHGRMVLLAPGPLVEAVLLSAGVDRMVPIVATLEAAIEAVSA